MSIYEDWPEWKPEWIRVTPKLTIYADLDDAIREERYRLAVKLNDRMMWGDEDEQREFAEWRREHGE